MTWLYSILAQSTYSGFIRTAYFSLLPLMPVRQNRQESSNVGRFLGNLSNNAFSDVSIFVQRIRIPLVHKKYMEFYLKKNIDDFKIS